jgi:hypothetical protein
MNKFHILGVTHGCQLQYLIQLGKLMNIFTSRGSWEDGMGYTHIYWYSFICNLKIHAGLENHNLINYC